MAGRPAQLVLEKLTVMPGEALAGVTVIVEIAGCPAAPLTLEGLADNVKGPVTARVEAGDVEDALTPM